MEISGRRADVAGVLGFATAVIAIVSRWKDGKTTKGMLAALDNQGKALVNRGAAPEAAPEPAEDAAKPEAKAATAGR